jgi:translation initiation factor 2 subunit 2
MSYEDLLKKAYEKVKKVEGNGERFAVPKVEGKYEGKKTILTNFSQILSHIRRNADHFQKFLTKELATSGQLEGDRFILNKKVPREKVDQKVEQYVKEFVLCKECKKPDTEIIKEDRINYLHCLACGAKHSIHKI